MVPMMQATRLAYCMMKVIQGENETGLLRKLSRHDYATLATILIQICGKHRAHLNEFRLSFKIEAVAAWGRLIS